MGRRTRPRPAISQWPTVVSLPSGGAPVSRGTGRLRLRRLWAEKRPRPSMLAEPRPPHGIGHGKFPGGGAGNAARRVAADGRRRLLAIRHLPDAAGIQYDQEYPLHSDAPYSPSGGLAIIQRQPPSWSAKEVCALGGGGTLRRSAGGRRRCRSHRARLAAPGGRSYTAPLPPFPPP